MWMVHYLSDKYRVESDPLQTLFIIQYWILEDQSSDVSEVKFQSSSEVMVCFSRNASADITGISLCRGRDRCVCFFIHGDRSKFLNMAKGNSREEFGYFVRNLEMKGLWLCTVNYVDIFPINHSTNYEHESKIYETYPS